MRPACLLPIICVLTACASKQDKKLEATKTAHSIVAEWAAVERLAEQSRLTDTYVTEMREAARSQLASLRQSFEPEDQQGRLMDGAAAQPSPERLEQTSTALDALEKQLELR